MGRTRHSRTLPPIRLGELRDAGIMIHVKCPSCSRAVDLDPCQLPFPDEMDIQQMAQGRLRCEGCGETGGINVAPPPRVWVAFLRATEQRRRLPFYAPMMKEEEDRNHWRPLKRHGGVRGDDVY